MTNLRQKLFFKKIWQISYNNVGFQSLSLSPQYYLMLFSYCIAKPVIFCKLLSSGRNIYSLKNILECLILPKYVASKGCIDQIYYTVNRSKILVVYINL